MFLKDIKRPSVFGGQEDGVIDHCMTSRVITHELFHVLGFLHEHQRRDRDKHIKIMKHNIQQGMNFQKFQKIE